MLRQRRGQERQLALFLLGIALFVPPILLIFNHPTRVLGIPSLYLYIFMAWAVLIGMTVFVARRIRLDDFSGRDPAVDDAAAAPTASMDVTPHA
jgi:hypothetical protein